VSGRFRPGRSAVFACPESIREEESLPADPAGEKQWEENGKQVGSNCAGFEKWVRRFCAEIQRQRSAIFTLLIENQLFI
jgi:hypothetical protein